MSENVSDGWSASASAWIVEQGEDGDYGRRCVLDAPMRARVEGRGFLRALDVGCGEGRFCRIMQRAGIRTTGIDPTDALLMRAKELDPNGDYRLGRAETMEVDANLLAEKLRNVGNSRLKVFFDYLPNEDHATIAHQAIFNAFRMIYPAAKGAN